jgi:hypothetical protein
MALAHLTLISMLFVAGAQGLGSAGKPELAPDRPGDLPAPNRNPYSRLFIPPAPGPQSRTFVVPAPEADKTQPDAKTRIVCGMVVVPVTPTADARMVVKPTQDPKPEYKMRLIAPRVCAE